MHNSSHEIIIHIHLAYVAQVPAALRWVNGGSICYSLYVAVPPATMSLTRWRGVLAGPLSCQEAKNSRAPTFHKWDLVNFNDKRKLTFTFFT